MKKAIITTLGIGVLLYLVGTLLYIASADAQEYRPPNNFYEYIGVEGSGGVSGWVMKGAVPGFAKKPKYFNADIAAKQLIYLHRKKGVKLVVSLDHCEDVSKVIERINARNVDVNLLHICRKIRRGRSDRQYERNIGLFEELARYIGNVPFYIHCRYGAHRAVTALTGAWVAHSNLSFDEAFKRTGGKKRAFRTKGAKGLLNHAKRYSKDLME